MRNVEDNGESFGCIDPMPSRPQNDDDSASDKSLNNLADEAADELLELDTGVDDSADFLNKSMPVSSQWMASLHGRVRACGKVKGKFEWDYFKRNLFNFMGGGASDEADNYSAS